MHMDCVHQRVNVSSDLPVFFDELLLLSFDVFNIFQDNLRFLKDTLPCLGNITTKHIYYH